MKLRYTKIHALCNSKKRMIFFLILRPKFSVHNNELNAIRKYSESFVKQKPNKLINYEKIRAFANSSSREKQNLKTLKQYY